MIIKTNFKMISPVYSICFSIFVFAYKYSHKSIFQQIDLKNHYALWGSSQRTVPN